MKLSISHDQTQTNIRYDPILIAPTDTSAASMTTLGTTSVLQPEKEDIAEGKFNEIEECIEPEEGDTNVDLTGEGPDVDNKDESNNHDVEQNIPNTEHVEGLTVDSKDESNIHEEPAADKEVPVIETTPVPAVDTTQNVVVNIESDGKETIPNNLPLRSTNITASQAVDTANEELNTNIITQGTTEQERKKELQRKKAERRADAIRINEGGPVLAKFPDAKEMTNQEWRDFFSRS